MNRLDWEDAARRLQTDVDPNHQGVDNNSMVHASRTNHPWLNFNNYQMYTVDEPHVSMSANVGWERLDPPSLDLQSKQSTVEDPDGEPLEIDEEDPELARKRKELREIEEQIMQKKVALALKHVEPFVKKNAPGFSSNEQSAACKGETLRDRVDVILQRQQSLSFLSKSAKERMKSSSLNKDGLLRHHPLKLRVKALMKKRCSDNRIEVSNVTVPSTSQSISSAAKEENSADKGFQRFLSVLNKGVDMDFLSRIINDESQDLPLGEELLNIPTVENKSSPLLRSESQRSNSGTSHTSGPERKSEPPSRERSHSEVLALPDGKKKSDGGESPSGSSSHSKSPAAVKKREEETNLDEKQQQLQNILKTLGLNLDVEEMIKLGDRTQERLYGKKCEAGHSKGGQESRQRTSQRHHRNPSSSSASSSSSSSSRSTSRSFSRSPCGSRRSHSRDSKERRSSEGNGSRDRSRERLKTQHSNQDGEEQQTLQDGDQKISAYQHPTYPHPQPAAFSYFPHQNLPQSSQFTTLPSEMYSTATNSYWPYTQDAFPAAPYSHGFPNPQNAYHHFPRPPKRRYPKQDFANIEMLMNPDLSTSEGQTGLVSGPRCLQVVSTKRPGRQSQSEQSSYLKFLTKTRKRRKRRCQAYVKKRRVLAEKRKQQNLMKRQNVSVSREQPLPSVGVSQPVEAEHSKDSKQPTEEEIKANLRKKLEAFNQKVKQQVTQPANSQTSKSVEHEDCL